MDTSTPSPWPSEAEHLSEVLCSLGIFALSRPVRLQVSGRLADAGVTATQIDGLWSYIKSSTRDPAQARRILARIVADPNRVKESIVDLAAFQASQIKHYPGFPVPSKNCRCQQCDRVRQRQQSTASSASPQ